MLSCSQSWLGSCRARSFVGQLPRSSSPSSFLFVFVQRVCSVMEDSCFSIYRLQISVFFFFLDSRRIWTEISRVLTLPSVFAVIHSMCHLLARLAPEYLTLRASSSRIDRFFIATTLETVSVGLTYLALRGVTDLPSMSCQTHMHIVPV